MDHRTLSAFSLHIRALWYRTTIIEGRSTGFFSLNEYGPTLNLKLVSVGLSLRALNSIAVISIGEGIGEGNSKTWVSSHRYYHYGHTRKASQPKRFSLTAAKVAVAGQPFELTVYSPDASQALMMVTAGGIKKVWRQALKPGVNTMTLVPDVSWLPMASVSIFVHFSEDCF